MRGTTMNRRSFLQGTALILSGVAAATRLQAEEPTSSPVLRIGMLTDAHYADKPTNINRYYRDTPEKLREAIGLFNDHPPDFLVHLGDIIDSGGSIEDELTHLRNVDSILSGLTCDRHYVLGNHCVDGLVKEEFLGATGMASPHYAFEHSGVRFVVLD